MTSAQNNRFMNERWLASHERKLERGPKIWRSTLYMVISGREEGGANLQDRVLDYVLECEDSYYLGEFKHYLAQPRPVERLNLQSLGSEASPP